MPKRLWENRIVDSGFLDCSRRALKPYSRPWSVNDMAEGVDLLDCSFSTITKRLPGRIRDTYTITYFHQF